MDPKKSKSPLIAFLNSFKHAFRGILINLKDEKNFQIHFVFVIAVSTISFLLKISISDFIIILLLFALVLSAELFNSAIEKICDILRDKYNLPYDGSRNIRDISAAAVLVNAIIATLIGSIIFLQYL
jgi:diacylglycerol kinase